MNNIKQEQIVQAINKLITEAIIHGGAYCVNAKKLIEAIISLCTILNIDKYAIIDDLKPDTNYLINYIIGKPVGDLTYPEIKLLN